MSPADSIDGQPFPSIADAARSEEPSAIEQEVMDLFEQFRTPLLRYAVTFDLSVHDAEEVIQEVFLSLFRHLQLGRSRKNLRGWIFPRRAQSGTETALCNAKIACEDGL